MSKNNEIDLSHVAFVVLGLVAEHPCHGKEINNKIDERGMRNWTAIGKSSIYGVLKKLKEDGLVDSWVEEEDNRVVKKYKITNVGLEVLNGKIYNVLNEFVGKDTPDFYLAYSMFIYLPKEQRTEVFTNSLNNIKQHRDDLEKMLEEVKDTPMTVTGLFKHPMMVLQTDIVFLEWVLDKIKKGDDEFGPEAYGK